MKTQHTPGPWKIQGNGTLNHPVSHRPLTTVRFETSLGTFEVLDETNEPDGNARLIAAAPELLAALETALKALAYHEQNTATLRGIIANGSKPWAEVEKFDAEWNAHNGAYKAVESAIAKAKGAK